MEHPTKASLGDLLREISYLHIATAPHGVNTESFPVRIQAFIPHPDHPSDRDKGTYLYFVVEAVQGTGRDAITLNAVPAPHFLTQIQERIYGRRETAVNPAPAPLYVPIEEAINVDVKPAETVYQAVYKASHPKRFALAIDRTSSSIYALKTDLLAAGILPEDVNFEPINPAISDLDEVS